MNFTSYDIVDFSIAAALEKRPDMKVNQEALEVLKTTCKMVDTVYEEGGCDIRTDVDKQGNAVIELINADTEKAERRWIVERVITRQ